VAHNQCRRRRFSRERKTGRRAGEAGRFLDIARTLLDRSVLHSERHAKRSAEDLHETLIGVALGTPQMMVDMQRYHPGRACVPEATRGEQVKKRKRILSA
jgi:hypothetical protein